MSNKAWDLISYNESYYAALSNAQKNYKKFRELNKDRINSTFQLKDREENISKEKWENEKNGSDIY